MKNEKGFTYYELMIVIVALLGVGGWIANIVKLISTGFTIAQWGGMEVARVIGIFIAPLGSVIGYF